MTGDNDNKKLNDYEDNILKNIDEHGFFVNSVFDPEGVNQSFSYSIGFPSSLKCPDFIIFGLPMKLMHGMLWDIFHHVKDGKTVEDGAKWSKLLDGDYVCVSKRVHPTNYVRDYLNSAIWYHKHLGCSLDDFSAFQLVWPGTKNNKFPWEEGCASSVIEAQPPLWLEQVEPID